jgi:DNA replication protein DnaC
MFVENAAKNTRDGYGLLLIGAPGVGKTHLAVSIVNELLTSAKHLRCLFRDFRELLADIRYSFNSEASVTEASLFEPGFRGGFAHYR